MAIATLLTDFGDRDYYVAAVKGVLLSHAPGSALVDVSHRVAPGDVEGAAFLLAAVFPAFPPGTVHLAVVDPGVGGERRILAAERDGSFLVAPDNGLLTPLLEGARTVAVDRGDLYLDAPGSTFHGRDRMAPVAAWLLRGAPLEALGPPTADPVRLDLPAPRRLADGLAGRVVHVDRFGNLVTDLPSRWLEQPFVARLGELEVRRFVTHYDQLPPGEIGLMPGSLGTLELALRGESLARAEQLERGTRVRIAFCSLQ